MSLEKVTGVSDKSWEEIAINTVSDGCSSLLLGKLPGVENITTGRNNMSAVYRAGLTKLRNGTALHMSFKVIGKGTLSSFNGGLIMLNILLEKCLKKSMIAIYSNYSETNKFIFGYIVAVNKN